MAIAEEGGRNKKIQSEEKKGEMIGVKKFSLLLCVALAFMVAFLPLESDAAKKRAKPGKVAIKAVKFVTKNKVSISWKPLKKNVKKYQVYQKSGKAKWNRIRNVSKSKKSININISYDTKTKFKVRAVNGKKAGKFSKVKTITIKSVKMDRTNLSMEKGETGALKLINAVGSVSWSSSNPEVATVSNGTVNAVSPGQAQITATNRGQIAACMVNVNGFIDVSEAYQLLNEFRTTPGIWQWNEDDKTKTVFNTPDTVNLSALAQDSSLEDTAKVRAKELVSLFEHTRPDGSSCFTAFPEGLLAAGENIACGQITAEAVTDAWAEKEYKYEGQGHRRNMLSEFFNKVGIACYVYEGTPFWVQDFAYI